MPAWIPAAIGAAATLAQTAMNNTDAHDQQQYNLELMKRQNEYNQAAIETQIKGQKEIFEATGYGARVRQMKEAGLNPGLIYASGASGGGGVTGSVSALGVSGQNAPNPAQSTANKTAAIGMGLQLAKLASEIDVNKSVAEANRASAGLNVEKTSTEPWNRFKTMAEEEILRYQANNEMRTQEAKVKAAYAQLTNLMTQNDALKSEINLKDAQVSEILQRVEQAAIKFDFDIEKIQAEIEKIVKETTNMDITLSQSKWIEVLRGLVPIIIKR